MVGKLARKQALGDFSKRLSEIEGIYRDELAPLPDMQEGIRAYLEKRPPKWS
jgi:enoyl-CoA hydratase/carnithine racemase